ncbi:hypothetical protein [Komagataeibacter oboediens]|uniref:hypothetical protein n=1 Tax=Komagataeibacter oboediens TaxID=65958 RepID=UPI001C2D923D|nr:hypothetical protein [Komagataeibacter oboediens]MBV1822590.1 hypothetical protein [Komagataeibacter oboediens]
MKIKELLMAGFVAVTLPVVAHAEDISWVNKTYTSDVLKDSRAGDINADIKELTGSDYKVINEFLHGVVGPASVVNNIAYISGCQPHMCMNFTTIAFDGNGHYWGYLENMDAHYTHTYNKIYGHPSPEILAMLKNRGVVK